MKFGILGYGYVGKATHKGLLMDTKAIVYDTIFDIDRSIIYNADTVFICIPTDNKQDIDIIIDEIKDIQQHNSDVNIIIRSTLPLGSCSRIQAEVGPIIYIPEFLRERHWDTDCLRRPLIVGYDVAELLPKWLEQDKIYKCSTSEAELVKMFSNNFAVMRIAFANVFYDLSESVGADYNNVLSMWEKIQHNQSYMEVPGHDGTRGFGGKCLPKDLDFLIETLEKHNIKQEWFKHIRELNKSWTKKS
jgi:UDPglucose 6-dehydrogenase